MTDIQHSKFFNYFEKYMYIIVLLNSAYFFIQAYRIYHDKVVDNIPVIGVALECFVSINFLIYGYFIKSKVLMLASLLNIIGTGTVIFMIYHYSN